MELILDETVDWKLEFPSLNGSITQVHAKTMRDATLVQVNYVCSAVTSSKLNKDYSLKSSIAYLLERNMYSILGFSHESMRHTLLNPINNVSFYTGSIGIQYGTKFIKEIDPYVRWVVNAKVNKND